TTTCLVARAWMRLYIVSRENPGGVTGRGTSDRGAATARRSTSAEQVANRHSTKLWRTSDENLIDRTHAGRIPSHFSPQLRSAPPIGTMGPIGLRARTFTPLTGPTRFCVVCCAPPKSPLPAGDGRWEGAGPGA